MNQLIFHILIATSICLLSVDQILSEKRSKDEFSNNEEVEFSNNGEVLFLDNESRDISKRDVFSVRKRRRKAKNLNLNNPGI